jgi:hypothetical protein
VNGKLISGEMFGAFHHNKPVSWKIIDPIFSKIGILLENDALVYISDL